MPHPSGPDMVFAANLAVVFNRRCVPARFRYPERRGEEAHFRAALESLIARRLVDEIVSLPPNLVQEGAGDCIWDESRQIFWAGYGPRSEKAAALWLGEAFDAEIVLLELATPRFYHLDTCFCPLSGGEVLLLSAGFHRGFAAFNPRTCGTRGVDRSRCGGRGCLLCQCRQRRADDRDGESASGLKRQTDRL